MGIFDMLKGGGIDDYAAEALEKGYTLVDVREPDEFAQGHIPGAINMPLSTLAASMNAIANRDEVLYVYCLSGGRSGRACNALRQAGFTNVTNIGGIKSYRGPIER